MPIVIPPIVAIVLATSMGVPVVGAGATGTAAAAATTAKVAITVAKAIPKPGWQYPLPGRPPVTRYFDPPKERWNAGHRGVVVFVGMVAKRPVVSLMHTNGVRTTYEPVIPLVKRGQPVGRGAVIGRLVPGHCPGRTCLHWGAKRGLDYIDPLSLLTDLQPVLLPLK